jgi:hypothetical protein
MLGMSVIMAWLRLSSGSLWTAAVFHASHNQFIQVFFTPATSMRGTKTSFAIDEFGFALPRRRADSRDRILETGEKTGSTQE